MGNIAAMANGLVYRDLSEEGLTSFNEGTLWFLDTTRIFCKPGGASEKLIRLKKKKKIAGPAWNASVNQKSKKKKREREIES